MADDNTPRSGRKKKKSALSKLAKAKKRQENDTGSQASLNDDNEAEARRRRQYPIDANVEVTQHGHRGRLDDDSDEGIEMTSGSYEKAEDRRRSPVGLDRMKYLNVNQNNDRHRKTSHSEEDDEEDTRRGRRSEEDSEEDDDETGERRTYKQRLDPIGRGSKRFRDQTSSGDEHELAKYKAKKFPEKRTNRDIDSDDVDSEKAFGSTSDLQQEMGSDDDPMDEYSHKRSARDLSKRRSHSTEELAQKYKEVLGNDLDPVYNSRKLEKMDSTEREEMYDSLSDLKHKSRNNFPLPGPSGLPQVPHNSTASSLRSSLLGSFSDQPGYKSATFDAMSQRSFQSTSVLQQLSTKDLRGRNFLVGSINSRGSLLGAEELERYFPDRKVRVYVGTWNMCEMKEPPASLDDFMLPESFDYVPDIYVIGTQESTPNRREWEIKLQETLGPQHVLFHSAAHGVLYLSIFLRRDLVWFCSVSEESNVTTRPGPSGIKTKGAVAVSFTFFGTSFLFINSHFSPHDGRVKDRIADYNKISTSLDLPKIVTPNQHAPQTEDVTTRFDCVFWCGDLNFRIEREREHVDAAVEGITANHFPDFEDLIKHDELFKARNDELAFQDFQEGRILFGPTYKYDVGTDNFDTSKKMRIPSYTDRVLFRSKRKNAVACQYYNSVPEIKSSDHRPVYAMFEVAIRPGRDNIPLAAGQFNRDVWIEANKRRSSKSKAKSEKNSAVCSIQ